MAKANMMATIAALTALEDQPFYDLSLNKNKEAKEYIYKILDGLNLKYVPSHTNFVFFHVRQDVRELAKLMRAKGIAIGRPFPPLTDWCRISTGKMEDVQKFGEALIQVMS